MSVPKLRFPEFRDVGEWEEKKLGEISRIVRGGSPRPIDGYLTTDSKGLNWLKIGDISPEAKYVTYTKERVRLDALKKTREVYPDDLILSNSMSFGRPYILKIKTCIHDGWIAVSKIDNLVNTDYLYYYISSPFSQLYFLNNAAGSGVQNLNADIIKLLPTSIPSLPEQKKIADCLSSIDDRITAETQKLDTLKAHKKGLMQQLFPAEGETMPKLRFPEFRDSGEWRESKLENILELLSGYAFKSEYFSEKGKKLLTPKNFTKDGNANFSKENTKFTTEECDSRYVCKEGDLLLLLTDLTPSCELLGMPIFLKKEDGESLLNQRIVKVIPTKETSIKFLLFFFLTNSYRKRIKNTATGSTVRHSSNKIILGTSLYFPSLPEQQKIADCLTSIDEAIAAQSQMIDLLKLHKKGLMQQLFPSVEEVKK
jgi:type I restriction enzyme S subunit